MLCVNRALEDRSVQIPRTYSGHFAVSLCGHEHIVIHHTLTGNDSVLQPLMHAAEYDSHSLVMVG